MPSCCVKWCVNNSTDHHKNEGISFHVFPREFIRRELWIKAVRLERQEHDWSPSKRTQICSMHFKTKDMYISNTGRQMIAKTGIPVCTMVFIDSASPFSENTISIKENAPIINAIKPDTRSSCVRKRLVP